MKDNIRLIKPEYFRLTAKQWDVLTLFVHGYTIERMHNEFHWPITALRDQFQKARNQAIRWTSASGYRGKHMIRAYLIAREAAVDAVLGIQNPPDDPDPML